MEDNIDHILQVALVVAKHGLKMKISKYEFAKQRVAFLGHFVDNDGVQVGPFKLEGIRSAPHPTSHTELCSFLVISGYYRRLIRSFASFSAPLHGATLMKSKVCLNKGYGGRFSLL